MAPCPAVELWIGLHLENPHSTLLVGKNAEEESQHGLKKPINLD